MNTVIESINNNPILGTSYIRSIKVVFASGADAESRGLPTPKVIREFDLITREDFFTLIKLCPMISTLTMEHPSFLLTNLRTGTLLTEFTKTSLPTTLFENLRSLTLMTAAYDQQQDLLREMLAMSNNLSHLHLGSTKRITSRARTTNFLAPPPPSTICPNLTSLKVEGSFYNRIVFNPEAEDSFLPLPSLTRLKSLEVPGGPDLDRLEPVAQRCGASLEILTFQFATNYSELSPILPYFTVLTTLSLTLHDTPIDFLHQIPITIKYLQMRIPQTTLQHFKSHPRPGLNLITIGLPPDPRVPEPWLIFEFIPSTVKRLVYFGSDLTAEKALKQGLIKVKEFEMPGCRFFKGVEKSCEEAGISFGRTGW